MTDIEIAESIKPKKIQKIAKKLHLSTKDLMLYGDNIAKVKKAPKDNPNGKLILVTAMTPTSAGIGKTTVSIGLADALHQLKESVCLALREPSLGPVFGIKGGATGGGLSQVIPMADINLHFTGDFHAITSANNLLCAMIDNHIFHGNELKIDPEKILFHRCVDINDRALRETMVGGRHEVFSITAASEIMAIMCLASSINDLKKRLNNIIVALNTDGNPVYAKSLKAGDSMAILLKDAMYPNLVQTLEGTPALIHMGPFANIAHGCNSITATKLAMSQAKYTITEAGFGSDLGAEKFLDIKCRVGNIKPSAVVIVATLQAIKLHGGASKDDLKKKDISKIYEGFHNLKKHVDNIKNVYNLPVIVAINEYVNDHQEELRTLYEELYSADIPFAINNSWEEGGKGAIDLAKKVKDLCEKENHFQYAYDLKDSIEDKIRNICQKIYGAKDIVISEKAQKMIAMLNNHKLNKLPIVIAKTQYSFSDNKNLLGAPKDFNINVRDIEIRGGAEFIVVLTENIMLMPGLPITPAATKMNIDNNNIITGLF